MLRSFDLKSYIVQHGRRDFFGKEKIMIARYHDVLVKEILFYPRSELTVCYCLLGFINENLGAGLWI